MKTLKILIGCFFITLNSAGQFYNLKFDTISEVIFNHNLKKSYSILDLKEVNTYIRRILLLRNSSPIDTLCNFSQAEYNGFAVNWIKENKNGFEISVEYGSRIYFQKIFYFIYKRQNFYLSKVVVNRFDKFKPEKFSRKSVVLKMPVCIDKFNLVDYLTN